MRQNETPKKEAFLAAYAECGIVSRAAESAEIGRASHYRWLNEDPEYKERFDEAYQDACEFLEGVARKRATEGWDEPVFHNGQECGSKRRYSDTLLIFLMKGAMPEKYSERHQHQHSGQIDHTGTVKVYIPDNGRNRLPAEASNGNGRH